MLDNVMQLEKMKKRRKSGSNEVQNMIINGPNDSISKISMQKKVVRETAVAIKLI